jgi:hypothetical protein
MRFSTLPKKPAVGLALVALPVLTFFALNSNSQNGNDRKSSVQATNDGKGQGGDDAVKNIPVVPEANAGWVLIPFVGAVLLLSWRQFSRAKA